MLGLVLGVMSFAAAAQQLVSEVAEYRSSWGVSGEVINFNADIAAANGISDSGIGLGLSYSGEEGLFNFTFGVSFFLIHDRDKFSQEVEDTWSGDESTEDSSIDAGSLYVDGGIRYPLSGSFALGLNAGYRYFDIERAITNCRDCYKEDVGIDSDTYLKPFVRFAFNESISGSLAYFSYTGDKGAENSLQFEVGARF